MNLVFRQRVDQVRRRWWVVVIVAAMAALAAALPALITHPKYVGKATLVVSSPERSPDQGSKVAVGYATVFNDSGTIDRLKATRNLPQNVTFEAKAVADTSILAIEATADSPSVAQRSATSMAEAFRDDVNSAQGAQTAVAIADLQSQLDNVLQRFPGEPTRDPSDLETKLRERINSLKYDAANQLRDLQLTAGVTPIAPNLRKNVAFGSAAGLLLGVLAALGLAAVSTRIGNSAELLEKTGIEPLVEVPSARSDRTRRVRDDRLGTLANILSIQISAKPTVVALIDARGSGAREIAEALAKVLAQQEYRTVLAYAEHAPQPDKYAGFDDVLRDSGLVHVLLRDGEVETLKVLPRGGFFANQYSHMTRARIVAVLDELRARADAVVVVAPSVVDTVDAQLLCAAADVTIVIVDARSSRTDDVNSVVGVVEKAGATVLGAVLINGSKRQSTGSMIARRPQPRHASEVVDQRTRPAHTIVPDLRQ